MARKRLQNRIAESRFALPVTAIYGLVMSVMCGLMDQNMWPQFGILAVSSYLMVELNNSNALIRVYSRMVSCSYIMLFLMSALLKFPLTTGLIQLFFIAFYLFFFHAYQNKSSMGLVFYAFLMLGIASTMSAHVLFLVPLMWILLFTNVLAGNLRTFFASVIGLILPYWFLISYYVYTENVDAFISHFTGLATFGKLFDYTVLTPNNIVVYAMLVLLMATGIIHFHRNSYKDKIRTRMIYEVFSVASIYVAVIIALQPNLYQYLIGILVVNVSPLIAHFVVFTRTRITNMAFFFMIAVIFMITLFNIWMPL